MNLNFTKVTYDGDLADFSEDELRDLVGEFENAQESNVAEFNDAADKLDEVGDIDYDEYEDARADLIGDITEADTFEQVPLTESELEEADFGKVRDWHDFVADQDEDEDDSDFEDMGTDPTIDDDEDDGQNHSDKDATELVDGISGVNVE